MNEWLHPTRLYWHHNIGVARHDGVESILRHAPWLEGLPGISEIDYIPTVMAHVRIGHERIRDMTAIEQSRAMELLLRMAANARDVLDGDTTIAIVGMA